MMTMMMKVRVFFLSMISAALPACGDPAGDGDSTSDDADITVENGCYDPAYVGVEAAEIGCGLLQSFGDPDFDMRFAEEVAIQSEFWKLSPTVYPFDECPGIRNALSSPQGFILFGINLTIGTILDTGSELPLAGALAHEWAHQVQFEFGWSDDGEPTVRSTELEADAFSGYYMGLAKSWSGEEIDTYFQTLFDLGDYQFNDPMHHGTPEERVAAGALGLLVAQQAIDNDTPYSHEELHQLFREMIARAIVEPATPLVVSVAQPELIAAVSAIAVGRHSIRTIPARPLDPTVRARLFPIRAADAPRVRR